MARSIADCSVRLFVGQVMGGFNPHQPPPEYATASVRPSVRSVRCQHFKTPMLHEDRLVDVDETWHVHVYSTSRETKLLGSGSLNFGPCETTHPSSLLICMQIVVVVVGSECTAGSDVLRRHRSKLATRLDARVVCTHLYQRNALTLKDLQSVQSLRDRPVEAAETLLNIILEQPDAVYLCFLDVLKDTGQQHIYDRLVEDGYKG